MASVYMEFNEVKRS